MDALRRNHLPPELEPLLRTSGFDGTVAVQASQVVEETEWLLTLADEYAFIKGVVGWVDLPFPACGRATRPLCFPSEAGRRPSRRSR